MARRSTRKRVWGMAQSDLISIAAGIQSSQPLASNLDPVTLEEATFVRTIGRLMVHGTVSDEAYFGIVIQDEDLFPTTVDPETSHDMDWVLLDMVLAVPAGTYVGVPQATWDIRSGRRLRERDREPYFVLTNSGAGAISIAYSIRTLFLTR